jgi:hypothetical protein
MKEVKIDDELICKRDALIKRRAELAQEIATCTDAIERIDTELQQDSLVLTGVSFSFNCQ